ncbi:DUF6154 family protein [Fodinisporobacter ferrooxydans]|uniref:DUF6154 family protein n=1 Tax=Fodinisporobacter ferrooxydans TaxID=2901836 RepID=A0ABY4CJ81_9BACL|nr:DUF6154 family protein [Alicyclobacillaceae bacterium MYW30-H2]
MKAIENIYQLYKEQLTGDEEDAVIIISSLLSELKREELMLFIDELSYDELYEMLGSYMVKRLLMRISQDFGEAMHSPLDGTIH